MLARLALLICLAGCATTTPWNVHYGNPEMSVGVAAAVDARGAIELPSTCAVSAVYFYADRRERKGVACPAGFAERNTDEVVVTTPWGTSARAVIRAGVTRVPIDWTSAPFDPLANNAGERLAAPWRIAVPREASPRVWVPSPTDVDRMLGALAATSGTEIDVVRGGAPPALAVAELIATPELRAGTTAELALTLENRGKGGAYRVVVTTRSSLDSLHGLRFAFGAIEPGAKKTRRAPVSIDLSTTDPSAMLVLVFSEGNDATPANYSQRFTVQPPALEPRLAVACGVRERMAERRVAVDAAVPLRLACIVTNNGGPARGVTLTLSLAGGAAIEHGPRDVGTGESFTFDVRVEVPRDAALDAELPLVATVRDRQFGRTAADSLVVVIDRAQVCPRGKLSRAAYKAKRAELEKAREAGGLTDAEFDAYDAELVGCLE